MKFLGLLVLISLNVSANSESVYGDDNRMDVFAVKNPLFVNLAKTTAAMIEKSSLKVIGTQTFISAKSLGDMYKLCPEERFRYQPTAAYCSGTLVAPDLIMTAAHCYEMIKSNCKDYAWVFDYKVSKENQSSVTVNSDNVYECESVILKEMNKGIDHALIKLNRTVSDRPYAQFRKQGSIAVNTPVVLIGHPSGLPTKVAGDGFVLKVLDKFFITNLDAFTVNSGSGVFNGLTGEVEGILSSGKRDYNGKGNCSSVIKYKMNEGDESVIKIDKVKAFLETYPRN